MKRTRMSSLRTHPLVRQIVRLLPYGLVTLLLGTVILFHYWTPQMRRLYPSLDTFLSRHAVERIAFLVPIAVATALFRWPGGTVTLGLAVAAMLPRALLISSYPADALLETVVTAAVGGLMVWLLDAQIRARVIRQQMADTMRFYARQITHAQEQERERLSRELHDDTIQMLIVLSRKLEVLAKLPVGLPEAAVRRIQDLQRLVSDTLRNLRRVVRDLRSPVLEHLGITATTEMMVDKLAEELGVKTAVQVDGGRVRLPEDQELALLRILQEALNNIRRHANASEIDVHLTFEPQATWLVVRDDGCGFSGVPTMGALVSAGKLGLVGMRERAEALGGTLVIYSLPGRGTTITAEIPRGNALPVPPKRANS